MTQRSFSDDSHSSYSEATPIVNKINQEDLPQFSQYNNNSKDIGIQEYQPIQSSQFPHRPLQLSQFQHQQSNQQSQSERDSEIVTIPRADSIAITKEETVILPSNQNPIKLLSIYQKEQSNQPLALKQQWSNFKSQQKNIKKQPFNSKETKKAIRPRSDEQRFGYIKLLQVLEDESNKQSKEDQWPKIIIAQGVVPNNQQQQPQQQQQQQQSNIASNSNRTRRSMVDPSPQRKPKKEPSLIAQRFLIQRQIRHKRKNAKKIRRKSCACGVCGGNTTYEQKFSDVVVPTVMVRKLNLANFLINSLRSQNSLMIRREKQMQVITTALEKTFHNEEDELNSKNSLISSFSYLDNIPSPLKPRNTLLNESPVSPSVTRSPTRFAGARVSMSMDPPNGSSKTLTKVDLENYKFKRNKQNYSRATQNIKKMRNTLFSIEVLKSLTTMNMIDENSLQKKAQAQRQDKVLQNSRNSQRQLISDDRRVRVSPYEVHERAQNGSGHQRMPPRIIPRRDLQDMLYKRMAIPADTTLSQSQSNLELITPSGESSKIINNGNSSTSHRQASSSLRKKEKGGVLAQQSSQIEMAHIAFVQLVTRSMLKQHQQQSQSNQSRQVLTQRNSNGSTNDLRLLAMNKLQSSSQVNSTSQESLKYLTSNTARLHYEGNRNTQNNNPSRNPSPQTNHHYHKLQQQQQKPHSVFDFQKEQPKSLGSLTAETFLKQKAAQQEHQQRQQQQASNSRGNSNTSSLNNLPFIDFHCSSFRS